MIVIGLNGRLHSGKDTAFQYINEHAASVGLFADRRAFADKLKLSAARALGFDPVDTDEAIAICNDLKETGTIRISFDDDLGVAISGREYLQWYGTEAHRDVFGTDFWVTALLPEPRPDIAGTAGQRLHVAESFPSVDILIITDVRFPNEAQRILDLGGEVWYIDADHRLGPLPEDAHVSERPLQPELLTRTVRNNGKLRDFRTSLSFAFTEAISR